MSVVLFKNGCPLYLYVALVFLRVAPSMTKITSNQWQMCELCFMDAKCLKKESEPLQLTSGQVMCRSPIRDHIPLPEQHNP